MGSGGIHLPRADLAALVLSGILGAASYAGFYRALQLGPVSLVSPIFSAYAVITVLLAVLLGQETVAAAAAAGIVLTVGGVVLASVSGQPGQDRPGQDRPGQRAGPRTGIWLALAAMVCWGVTTSILGQSAQQLGWFVPVAASRVVTFGSARRHRRGSAGPPGAPAAAA